MAAKIHLLNPLLSWKSRIHLRAGFKGAAELGQRCQSATDVIGRPTQSSKEPATEMGHSLELRSNLQLLAHFGHCRS